MTMGARISRGERRQQTDTIIKRRLRVLAEKGMQQGTIYERHRNKVTASGGYMRDGNLSHYASVGRPGHKPKTRSRNQYGHFYSPPVRDRRRTDRELMDIWQK